MATARTSKTTSRAATMARDTNAPIISAVVDARRIVPSIDIFGAASQDDARAFAHAQVLASTHFFNGLKSLKPLVDVTVLAASPVLLPDTLVGSMHGSNGDALPGLIVTLTAPKTTDLIKWHDVTAITGPDGAFTLVSPAKKIALDPESALALSIRGANGTETLTINAKSLGTTGYVGELVLRNTLRPVPTSILTTLSRDLAWTAAVPAPDVGKAQPSRTTGAVKLGEGECELSFTTDLSDQRHPYSVLFRLVEPRPSILTRTFRIKFADVAVSVAARNPKWGTLIPSIEHSLTERVPVDQPISVDGFRDQVVGVNAAGVIEADEKIPMAGTLGLGYVLRLAQEWTPEGLALGNLVYSLPLAPGEQQRIAVYEQRQTLSTREFESFDEQQQEASRQAEDSSTQAVFQSAFNEAVIGTSQYATHAESSSWGAAGGIGVAIGPLVIGGGAAGGGGSADASGSSKQTLDGNRHFASMAAQNMHSATERNSAAHRAAQRTSIRMSTATDETVATTKVITNNNRLHALTIQYWEVQRHFSVSTAVQGVTLVCFVPLEVVRFLPVGQKLALAPNDVATRDLVLARYQSLHKHLDVLERWLARKYLAGLKILADVVANPRYVVDVNAAAEEIIDIALVGAFLPFETIYVSLLTRRGGRFGPIKLSGSVKHLPDRIEDPDAAFSTRAELLAGLHARRGEDPRATTLSASLALPATVGPQDIAGFEISRNFSTLRYALAPRKDDPNYALLEKALQAGEAGALVTTSVPTPFIPLVTETFVSLLNGITLGPAELEAALGGPVVSSFQAKKRGAGQNVPGETISAGGIVGDTELPSSPYPVAALDLNPVLKFHDLLQIETTLQHVVRNTVTFSKAVWMSLTPEERAIMLEGFTIGVPEGGLPDGSQNIPLLNCVANQVLGYFGNAMIMPFSIPPAVGNSMMFGGDGRADGQPLTTGVIQDALTNFHRAGFSPPQSHVALPTRGVLAEAVLGCCPSGE